MSEFFSKKFDSLTPYVPGEQPQDKRYIKLNTNENPFPLPLKVRRQLSHDAKNFQLYSDPEFRKLRRIASSVFSISEDCIMFSNGSDDALNFIFMAFCDNGAAFADITYGFYPVIAQLNGVDYKTIPLRDDFSIGIEDYYDAKRTIFIANPNAPTGLALSIDEIEKIIKHNSGSLIVIDEAYVDFGTESAIPLVKKYPNIIVVQTFSKSRFMAGLRLGAVFTNKDLIRELNTIRYSINPYNVNYAAQSAGCAILRCEKYRKDCTKIIQENRLYTYSKLKDLGFEVLDSKANFLFAKSDKISGEKLYRELKSRGILIRHFDKPRIKEYNRISIGTFSDMKKFIKATEEILKNG